MNYSMLAAQMLSRKETRDGIKKLTKMGVEKIFPNSNLEAKDKTEKLYPGIKRGTLPDCLAQLENRKPTRKEITTERQGAKLTTDVAQRLWNERITPKAWENASFEDRKKMLLQAKQVMGQEMLLSPKFRQSLKVTVTDDIKHKGEISGNLIRKNGKISFDNPQIKINSGLLKNDDCEGALEELYREMVRAMKYDSLSEMNPSSKEYKLIAESIGKETASTLDALKNPLENEIFGQAHVFKMAYQIEGQKHPSELSTKPKEVSTQKEFTTSTELHADKIKEVFKNSPELQFQQWRNMDVNQRLNALQNFENEIAKIEQRNPEPIFCEKIEHNCNGYHTIEEDGTGKIALSSKLLYSIDYNGYKQTLKTLLHEGRHSYQTYNLRIKRTEPSDDLIKQWKINYNFFGYQQGDASLEGYYRYYIQPVEADANLFADTAIKKMGI